MTEEEFENAFAEMLLRKHDEQEFMDNYYNGVGTLKILVTLNIPEEEIFEYEVLECTGCVQGAEEMFGIDYLLKDMWYINQYKYPFREGMIYTFHHVTASWIKGDGYTTGDDVNYYHGTVSKEFRPWTWFKTKMDALWWKHIGWRL